MKKVLPLLIFMVILATGCWWWLNHQSSAVPSDHSGQLAPPPVEAKTQTTTLIPIETGQTYSMVMTQAQIDSTTSQAIFEATRTAYDLSNIRAGKAIRLTFDGQTSQLAELMYPVSDTEELYVTLDKNTVVPDTWQAEKKAIDYEIKLKTFEGTINASLYEDGLKLGIPEGTLIEFANIFEYSIDYAYDIRIDDTFKLVYEERYRDHAYIIPGRILAGRFINQDKQYLAYYFEENAENQGYFDEQGHAIQKIFLRAPVAFKYISSGFTAGKRYISAFNVSTGHRAIDYAAPVGTPIRSVGDGTVIQAGWSKAGYGNLTSIRHNTTYTTNYAHQSKIIVRVGQRVVQGQVIGYVGSTGFSTGPHLHYEMVKNGVKINPLKEVLPPGKPIKQENMEKFQTEKARLDELIK